MKKILLALVCLMMFTACSSNKTGEVIWKNNKTTYTTSDLNADMLDTIDVTNTVMTQILTKIAEKDSFEFDRVTKEIEESYDYYVETLGAEITAQYMGTKDYFKEVSILNSIISFYVDKDVEANLDSYIEKCKAYQAEIIYVDSEDAANAIKKAVSDGTNTFEFAASENGYSKEISKKVYTDLSDLPVEVKELVMSVADPGVYVTKTTTYSTSNNETTEVNRFYLVNLISKNVDDFMDDFKTEVKASVVQEDSIINDVLVKNNVTIHDQKVYDYISAKYPGVK